MLSLFALAVFIGRLDTAGASGVRDEEPAFPGPHPTMIGWLHEEAGEDDWMVLVPAQGERQPARR